MKNIQDKGPYSYGVNQIKHKGKYINTIINSKDMEILSKKLDSDAYSFEIGYIPAGYEHRPDKISNLYYNTPKYWWILMLVNNINDPFEGFYVNQKIIIPNI